MNNKPVRGGLAWKCCLKPQISSFEPDLYHETEFKGLAGLNKGD